MMRLYTACYMWGSRRCYTAWHGTSKGDAARTFAAKYPHVELVRMIPEHAKRKQR